MSSTTTPQPKGASALDILQGLAATNGPLTLAITVGNVVVPLVVALVKKLEGNSAGPNDPVEYTLVFQTTEATLQKTVDGGNADIADINAELAKLGLPALALIPDEPAPAPAAPEPEPPAQ